MDKKKKKTFHAFTYSVLDDLLNGNHRSPSARKSIVYTRHHDSDDDIYVHMYALHVAGQE